MSWFVGERGIPTLAHVVENAIAAVVNVSAASTAPVEANPLFRDPFVRYFLDLAQVPRAPRQMSAGAGDLRNAIGLMRAGSQVRLTLLREGARAHVIVGIG